MTVLTGKAVVITGAGQGLGREYALHAAAAGAAVVVNDVDGELAEQVVAEIVESGGRAVASAHTVADPVQARAVIASCVTEFGAIDGLVNNAGISYHANPWADDPARARELIEVNVLGTLYCGTAAAEVMRAAGRGSIVNAASGAMLGQPGAAAYSASKGAVASMAFSWAVDLAESGVRVNAVAPLAWTRMMRADPRADIAGNPELTPDRVAPLVTYLLSELSAGITGQMIRCTGESLHLMRLPAMKAPVLDRERWTVEDIAAAFAGEFALEPPPASRLGTLTPR